MDAEKAIAILTRAISLVSDNFDKDELLDLIEDVVDEKHWHYIEAGLAKNDKASILHGLMGALSHYEAQGEKQKK